MNAELLVFVIFGALAMGMALRMVFQSNPVHAALHLVVVLVSIAVLFLAQEAYFLSVVQIVVYTGAIVVLFLFVIMLLGVDKQDDEAETLESGRFSLLLFGGILVGLVAFLAPIAGYFSLFEERGVEPGTLGKPTKVNAADSVDRYDAVNIAGTVVPIAHLRGADGAPVSVVALSPAEAVRFSAELRFTDKDLVIMNQAGVVQDHLQLLPQGNHSAIDPSDEGDTETVRPDIQVPDYDLDEEVAVSEIRALVHLGNVEVIADSLFTTYLLPFEVVSILLVAGIIGGVVLAKRDRSLHGSAAGRSDEALVTLKEGREAAHADLVTDRDVAVTTIPDADASLRAGAAAGPGGEAEKGYVDV